MTGVYEHALGDDAAVLHPKVRERYGIGPDDDQVCVGRGRMDINRGLHMLPALYAMAQENLLFPEAGQDVPFTVTTVGYRTNDGHEALITSRAFDFDGKHRQFDSVTLWDAETERLFDFLGRHGLIATELQPRVEDGALVIGGGRQWLRAGSRYVPIPGPFAADVEVRDQYDETNDQYRVTATIESTLTGHILSYRGTFTQKFQAVTGVPDELQPAPTFSTLPPQ